MTHASLFSGIGGPEVAATMLGWENLFHCEINEFGRKVLDYWFPKSKSYEDITKTDFSEWRGKVDVLTGGFPCQPFSYAGQRRGADDDRYLWPYMFKAIGTIRPAWVVAENVAGITTMVEQGDVVEVGGQASMFEEIDDIHRYRLVETFTLQRICDNLESHGYAVQPVLIPACAVGAPHRRDRVFIVARRIASDTDNGADRRTVREDEGKGGEERICGETSRTDSTHPDSHRGCEVDEHMESELADGAKPVSNGGQRNVADTASERPQAIHRGRETVEAHRDASERIARSDSQRVCEYQVGERWQDFPSVSPVHRGNDGLPFYVDSLSIPFSKWRTESLKAYGNSIVPQVMFEIFRAIELVNNQ